MHVDLTVLSFLCATLLLGTIPAYWSSRNVAMLSLIVWLLACNIIGGVNTIVWAGNSSVHIPVWCDIATKVQLGSQTALPAACLCLSRHLQRCTAGIETKQRWRVLSFDYSLCVFLPVLYMALHIIVQDHRFDLVEDFGCEASLYPSTLAIVFVWIPPLILCSITLVYACLAAVNYSRLGPGFGSATGDTRALPPSTIARPLITSAIIVSLVLSSVAFSIHARVESSGGLQPWTSWALVHAHLSTVNIIPTTARLDLTRIEFSMWIAPAASLVLIISACLGFTKGTPEETSTGYRSIADWLRTVILRRPVDDLSQSSFMDLRPHMILRSPTRSAPVHRPKSAWEDTVRPSSPFKFKPSRISIPEFDSPIIAPISPVSDDSDAFVQSTITYLESPTGRSALGLAPLQPSLQRPSKPPPLPEAALVPSSNTPERLSVYSAPESPGSLTPSILSEPWPRPPSLIPTSPVVPITVSPPTPEPAASHARPGSISSLSTSLASSTVSTHAYAHEPGFILHDAAPPQHLAPFADAHASAHGVGMRPMRHARSRDNLVTRNLSLRPRERVRQAVEHGVGAIYMTVVKETA